MASSGSFKTGNYQGRYLLFSWSISSQSVANNTTTISWSLKGAGTADSSWYKAGNFKVVIDGKTVYSTSQDDRIKLYDGTLVASGTTPITHNTDGTKSFTASAQAGIYTYAVNKSGSGTWDLTAIPRKSTLSVGNGTLGTSQTLTVTRQSTSFTHSIKAVCGSSTLYIKADGSTSSSEVKHSDCSIPFTPPISWASQNKTGTSVSITYTITTYNGSTNVGSNSYHKSCTIPSSVKPSVSVAVSDPMGYVDKFGAYVQGQSKMKIAVTASGNQGSTITSYKVTADGKTYTTATTTTGVISKTGTQTISVTVTDSRGRTNTVTKDISVLAYSTPTITYLSVKRCNENGIASNTGAYMLVSFGANITALNNKNTATYKVEYKKSTDAKYTTLNLTNYSGVYVLSDGSCVFPAETASSYDIVLTVTDALKSVPKPIVGSSIKKLWSILKRPIDRIGIAIGKIAELENVLDIAMPVKLREGIIQDVLWSGALYMTSGHTATFSELVSKQPSGIVLVFSLYDSDNETGKNQEFFEFFIPKWSILEHSGSGRNFNLCGMFGNGVKYLYLHDDKIVGNDKNSQAFTIGGITYDNTRYVLRYVIGV